MIYLTGDWIVTLQEFMIMAVNPPYAEGGYIKHIGLLDLLAVWFMQIWLDRFSTCATSVDIYGAQAIIS